jgi:hypothetical protein
MSAVSSRHAIDTLPIKVYCRDGSHITVKLGPLATCSDLHRGLVMKVRGMKEQMVLKDSDPLLRYFAVYTVTSETFLERLRNPSDNVWAVKEEFKLASDHFEFARLVARSPSLVAPVPCAPQVSSSSRQIKDSNHAEEDLSGRIRSAVVGQGPQGAAKRSASPRPVSAAAPTLSSSRRARSDVDAIAKYKMERAAQMGAAEEAESSDDPFLSPPTSPRPSTTAPTSPRASPKRLRRMSIGGTPAASATIGQLTLPQNAAASGSVPQLSHVSVPTKVDSTLLWADFLEATHLVATCPLFKPKEPTDVTELAALHFYIFSLQSPPSESSSRKEKSKGSSTTRESAADRTTTSTGSSGGHSVHIEESPALSKTYRKALHKNMGAFFPVRLQSLWKGIALEEAVWVSYTDLVSRKLTVEDGMQEYTRIFNRWRYSDVRLFFEVKREVSALLTPKSSILAINEDGIAILKKDKENELVASYLYTNMANWTVYGNCLTLEVLPDDSGTSSLTGTTLYDSLASPNMLGAGAGGAGSSSNAIGSSSSSGSLLQVPSSHSGSNPLLNIKSPSGSSSPLLGNRTPGGAYMTPLGQPATQVSFLTQQADTIATIIQFYIDRLTAVIFERAEILRSQPSPRIFLLTDIASNEPSLEEHRIAVESLVPALNQLKEERSKSGSLISVNHAGLPSGHVSHSSSSQHHDGAYSSTSDSDRETNFYHSGSADALSGTIKRSSSSNASRETLSRGELTASGSHPPSSPSSPSLGRRRAPSLPRSQMESSRLESIRSQASENAYSGDESPHGSNQDGPRRSGSKKRSTNHRLNSSRQSDTETTKDSESDREKMTVVLSIPTDGSESDHLPSHPDSPSPHPDLDSFPNSSFSDSASTTTL